MRAQRFRLQSVNQTVNSASTLLNTWTRILSQTEHNQRLILNHAWQGASQDRADQEQEAYARQQAAEQRELELPRRSALKMRRGGKRRQLRGGSKPLQRGRGRPPGKSHKHDTACDTWLRANGWPRHKSGSRRLGGGTRRTTKWLWHCQGYRVRKRTGSRNLIFETSSIFV